MQAETKKAYEELCEKYDNKIEETSEVSKELEAENCVVLQLNDKQAELLSKDSDILNVEEDAVVYASSLDSSEENASKEQWNLRVMHSNQEECKQGKDKIKVAILDSGISASSDIYVKERINLIPGEEYGVEYPAAYPEVMAVGSVDLNAERSTYSAMESEVEVVAPGEMIPAIDSSEIKSITIPASCTYLGKGFVYSTSLSSIKVAPANKKYASVSGVLYDKKKTTLITFPSGRKSYKIPQGVEKIADGAFARGGIRQITLPDSLKVIGKGDFSWCSKLKKIVISKNVEIIGTQAFESCRNLKKVEIHSKKLMFIGKRAFYNLAKNVKFTYPGLKKKVVTYKVMVKEGRKERWE